MKRALSAADATKALLEVAAPATSGAAIQPGKAGLTEAAELLSLFEALADSAGHGPATVEARNRFTREEAMTLTNSTTEKLIGLPQQTGKP